MYVAPWKIVAWYVEKFHVCGGGGIQVVHGSKNKYIYLHEEAFSLNLADGRHNDSQLKSVKQLHR